MPPLIKRRLRWINPQTREWEAVEEAAVARMTGPVVVLGDPGLGKSTLAEQLGGQDGNRHVRAGSFIRSMQPDSFCPAPGRHLIIDGLDEVASAMPGGGIDTVLQQLSRIGYPPFILTSREADWRGASARIRIEDDYGGCPVTVLHLEPFSKTDAYAFLQSFFPDIDASQVLDHLASRGLEEIYSNPLTLRMIGEIAQSEEALPATRPDLLERACALMLREANPRHDDAVHARCSQEQLQYAAGAMCACLLLCDRLGIHTGPAGQIPDGFLHLSQVVELPQAERAAAALKTRLFQADGEERFVASHRVIAEYLGALWLAACFDSGASERRIRSLMIRPDGGVPTSLRGLNAWLAHFSHALAPACIAADPYAVLRYGNAETLSLGQARVLLKALSRLSAEDPYFRAEDWNRHSAAGLTRMELKDDIVALIADKQTPFHLASLLLELNRAGIAGGCLV